MHRIDPLADAELLLGKRERVGPQARLEMRLELRKIEIARAVEERDAEVEEAAGDRFAVDEMMPLRKMPAAGPDQERCDLVVQPVALLCGVERELAAQGVADVEMPLHDVLPGRRVRVLEIRHEAARAGVERVDHHLAVDRPGDLAAAVLQVGRCRRDAPVAFADLARVGQKRWIRARVEIKLPLGTPLEQLEPPGVELAMEALGERERLPRDGLLLHRADHEANCASSVEPLSASVDASGDTACVTRSK